MTNKMSIFNYAKLADKLKEKYYDLLKEYEAQAVDLRMAKLRIKAFEKKVAFLRKKLESQTNYVEETKKGKQKK